MFTIYKKLVQTILDKWPLQKQLGFYAFLPAFFLIGAWSEFVMIHMRINGIDFYSVYLRRQQQQIQEKLRQEHEWAKRLITTTTKTTMPFGLSWSAYMSRVLAALIATGCGSQFVHNIYRPIDNRLEKILDLKKANLAQQELESSSTTSPSPSSLDKK